MDCLGEFKAQYFKWLSFDPNTIFQFFVFPDRIFLVKVGSALNQIPQVATHGLVGGPVGLKDHAAGGLPTLEQARGLVAPPAPASRLKLETTSMPNREIALSSLTECRYQANGSFKKGLHLQLATSEKLFFRFLSDQETAKATALLSKALGTRFVRQ
jgi:hypothetical protein